MTRPGPVELPAVHEAWLPREHSLHRPRHGGKQTGALACAAVFFLAPLAGLALGARPAEIENRKLAAFPSPVEGWAFFTDLPAWATDHLVFRGDAISIADGVSRGVFGEPPQLGTRAGSDSPLGTHEGPAPGFDITTIPRVIEGTDGWLYLGDEVAVRCKQDVPTAETMRQIRAVKEGIEASGRDFLLVIAPDKITVEPEHLPQRYPGQDCVRPVTDEFWRLIKEGNLALDLRSEIHRVAESRGVPVYPARDAHWDDIGGLLMARGIAEWLRPGVTKDWVVADGEPWRVPADLPPLIGRTGDIEGRHYSVKPDGVREQARDVPQDFTTPLHLNTTSGPGTYGRKVAMLGDSFTIRAKRYLGAAFGDLTLLHYKQLQEGDRQAAIKMLVDSDVVVFEVAERALVKGNSVLFAPEVVEAMLREMSANPRR
ncbi:hypothetical protein ACFQV2_39170 [Actinokineospora soli]|uniref:AlgX/AlgJ SGNH hydrolase-like domain-containing protein n=1 Tax=Actinokineospora soli TaxID=1048753 RepID=A0ABW2U012_9PSEU